MKKTLNTVILPLLVMALYGYSFPAVRLTYLYCGVDQSNIMNLYVFAGIRFFIAGSILLLVSAVKGDLKTCVLNLKSRDEKGKSKLVKLLPWFLLFAALHVTLNCIFTYLCISIAGGAMTSLLKRTAPLILVPFLCFIFPDEKFTVGKLLGAVLGILAVIVVNIGSIDGVHIGSVVAFIPAIVLIFSDICSRKLREEIPALLLMSFAGIVGGLILAVIGYVFGGATPDFQAADGSGFSLIGVGIAISLLVVSVVGDTLWYYLVQTTSLANLYLVRLLETFFASVFSFLILKEDIFRWTFIVGFILTVFAVVVGKMEFRKKQRSLPQTNEAE